MHILTEDVASGIDRHFNCNHTRSKLVKYSAGRPNLSDCASCVTASLRSSGAFILLFLEHFVRFTLVIHDTRLSQGDSTVRKGIVGGYIKSKYSGTLSTLKCHLQRQHLHHHHPVIQIISDTYHPNMQSRVILLGALSSLMRLSLAIPLEPNTSPVAPALQIRDTVNIGFGQQLQKSTEQNYWVVWEHGKSACTNTRTIAPLIDSPCGIIFSVPAGTDKVKLGDCDGNNEPRALLTEKGDTIRGCKVKNHKINCHHGLHDIVQHGHCSK